jgi:transcriptional regulator with XRE-family HTH domain
MHRMHSTVDKGALDRALKEIGARMGSVRDGQDISQGQVAKSIGRKKPGAQSAISRWESGTVPPTIRELLLYADAVNKPITYFFDGIITTTPEQLTNGLDHESLNVVTSLAEFLKKRRPA